MEKLIRHMKSKQHLLHRVNRQKRQNRTRTQVHCIYVVFLYLLPKIE